MMKKQAKSQETKKTRTLKGEIISWCATIAVAFAAALFINSAIIVNATVPTPSMEDTIKVGDRVMGFRHAYLFSEPERGEVILFQYPDDETQLFIKRIIGVPGDTIEIVDGSVYVNAQRLEEPYLREKPAGDFGPYHVPEDAYFVMGDNRNDSLDSRYWKNQFVYADKIKAKAEFCYFPKPYLINR